MNPIEGQKGSLVAEKLLSEYSVYHEYHNNGDLLDPAIWLSTCSKIQSDQRKIILPRKKNELWLQ